AQRIAIRRAVGDGRAGERAIAEQIDSSQQSSGIRRMRSSVSFYRSIGIVEVRVVDTGIEPEDALARHVRQRVSCGVLALQVALAFKQNHKESFAFDDRSAD